MPELQSIEYDLPAHLACPLMYADYSALEDDEVIALEQWEKEENAGTLVSVSEDSEFCAFHDYWPDNRGADCATFTFHKMIETASERGERIAIEIEDLVHDLMGIAEEG